MLQHLKKIILKSNHITFCKYCNSNYYPKLIATLLNLQNFPQTLWHFCHTLQSWCHKHGRGLSALQVFLQILSLTSTPAAIYCRVANYPTNLPIFGTSLYIFLIPSEFMEILSIQSWSTEILHCPHFYENKLQRVTKKQKQKHPMMLE